MPETKSTRQLIVDAAGRVMAGRGLGRTTTRAIAEECGRAEGLIYRYFPAKADLIFEVLRHRYPAWLDALSTLPERAGEGTVRENLEEVARHAMAFWRETLPVAAGILADAELLTQHRRLFRRRDAGPHRAFDHVGDYLRSEQRLGRVAAGVDVEAAARLLLGASFTHAFVGVLTGRSARDLDDEGLAARLAGELLRANEEGAR